MEQKGIFYFVCQRAQFNAKFKIMRIKAELKDYVLFSLLRN